MRRKNNLSSISGVGIDITEIRRFRALLRSEKKQFLKNTFSEEERAYCAVFKDPAPHFAGTFAAKEAAQKAMGNFSMRLSSLEVRRTVSGKPEIWLAGKFQSTILVSISHTKSAACAVVIQGRL